MDNQNLRIPGLNGFLTTLISILVFLIFAGVTFRLIALTFVDNFEQGYSFDRSTGKIERIAHTGYVFRWPILVSVHTVDLRPMQVCISANKRVLNCKLVEFNPEGLELFLSWHGRNDYKYRVDQTGHPTDGSLNSILMTYAYDTSGKSYPFLRVLRELKEGELPK